MRRATIAPPKKRSDCLFQSTLSMRRATHRPMTLSTTSYISIHALHEESDRTPLTNAQIEAISIHALHEESDPRLRDSCPWRYLFQSTLSMRRATKHPRGTIETGVIISIHALHEESDSQPRQRSMGDGISIHALHEESDAVPSGHRLQYVLFQSTLSMRRATGNMTMCGIIQQFQSTLSMRRATPRLPARIPRPVISIHALHEESDRDAFRHRWCEYNFNPRSP